LPNHPITPLASAQINHDQLTVELIEPDGLPAKVKVTWPPQPTIIDPTRFPDVAATIARLFAEAHTVLASVKAARRR
jgi:hypothetical protein